MLDTRPSPVAMNRTLPIRVAPAEGEALDSYLEALAHRSGAAWGDLIVAVGLGGPPMRPGKGIYDWLVRLTESQTLALSHATGVDASCIESMTFAGLLRSLNGATAIAAPVLPLLRSPARSRFCPRCLSDSGGRWQLWWRLRWGFACPQHHCLLADGCPECGRWQRVGPSPSEVTPTPESCSRKTLDPYTSASTRCGGALSSSMMMGLATDHPVLTAQRRILGYLTCQSVSDGIYASRMVDVSQFLADLAAVGTRVFRCARSDNLQRRVPTALARLHRELREYDPGQNRMLFAHSATSAGAALAAVAALRILDSPDVLSAGPRMRWLVTTPPPECGMALTASHFGWGKTVSDALRGIQLSALEPYLGPSDQLRYRCGTQLPRDPKPLTARHHHVPALLWRPVTLRFSVADIGAEQLAAALAAAVIVIGTRVTLSQAASLLGSVITPTSASRVLQVLNAENHWPDIRMALIRIADAIDAGACPIDYHDRRALPFSDLFADVPEICYDDTGTLAGQAMKLQLVRCWMYERITGSPARRCSTAIKTREFRSKLTELSQFMTPNLITRLDHTARDFLDTHGCSHEPLHWHPPTQLLLNWPPRHD
jgi:hypothetical protein